MEEINRRPKEKERYTVVMYQKNHHSKDFKISPNVHNTNQDFNSIPFVATDKLIQKIILKGKGTRIAKLILKKKNAIG